MCKTPESIQAKLDSPMTMAGLFGAVREAVATVTARQETFSMPGVAKFFGAHPQTCRRWVKRGVLPPPAIKVGRTVRWSRAQLESVLAAGVSV